MSPPTQSTQPPQSPPPQAPPSGVLGIAVVSGGSGTDTVAAFLAAPLVVEVRDSAGALASGRIVAFSATNAQIARDDGSNSYFSAFSTSTDSTGHARVLVRLSTKAGPSNVAIAVQTLALSTTAQYTTRAGNASRLTLAPHDTALYPQNGFQARTTVVDRFNNARQDTVTFAAGPLAVAVSPNGQVTAGDLGRVFVAGRVGAVVDTAWVSIVPRGTVAGFFACDGLSGLGVMQLDGSGARIVGAPGASPDYPTSASWSPDGTHLTYSSGGRVHVTDLSGNDRRLTALTTPAVEMIPRYSLDGQWIWYSAGAEWPAVDLWRARADGTGTPARVGPIESPPAGYYNLFWQPIAFADNMTVGFLDGGWYYHVRNLATGTEALAGGTAHGLHYSAAQNLIAYGPDDGSGGVWVMRPDGTGARSVVTATGLATLSVDWSSDGQWILAAGSNATLINYATGLTLPLNLSCMPAFVVWRPGS